MGMYYTMIRIRSPQEDAILIIEARTLPQISSSSTDPGMSV